MVASLSPLLPYFDLEILKMSPQLASSRTIFPPLYLIWE